MIEDFLLRCALSDAWKWRGGCPAQGQRTSCSGSPGACPKKWSELKWHAMWCTLTSPEHPSILLSEEVRVLVQSLAPLHHPDGCRDAGYGWHLDHGGYGFKYSAECGRIAL